jgi:predicted PurR-regulated permease PerM
MSEITRTRIRMAMVIVAVLGILWILWLARSALIPFILGAVLAYIIAPLVDIIVLFYPLNRLSLSTARGIAIFLVYTVAGALLALLIVLAGPPLVDEMNDFIDSLPDRFEEVEDWYEREFSEDTRDRIEDIAGDASAGAGDYLTDLARGTASFLIGTISVILGFILVPFWLFYLLKDQEKNANSFYGIVPQEYRQDARNCVAITNRVAGAYVRARLVEGVFIGVATTIGLYFIGLDAYIALGIIAGVTELIPFAGPVLGAIPALLVAITTEDWQTVLIVLAFFVALQQFESAVLVPNIEGRAVNTHPALVIFVVIVAGQIWGFLGILLAVPVSAIIRDLFTYVYRRLDGLPAELVFRQVTEGLPREDIGDGPIAPRDLRQMEERAPGEPAISADGAEGEATVSGEEAARQQDG